MKPGAMGFVPRTRAAMEAVDLGLSLLQAHWRPVAQVWALQVALLLGLLLPFCFHQPLGSLLLIWWLKPWLDRGILFVLSRAVFGQPASLWDFLREWRSVHRRGLVAGLLWRRLSPMRSYVLPIAQLEGLHGAGYRHRSRVLTRQGGVTGFLLTCSGWIFSLMTLVGCLALLQAMMPPGSRVDLWAGFQTLTLRFQWFLLAAGILVLTLTEPVFVAGGFGLYLNRRTHLEGWDLELVFRRLAARLAMGLLLALCVQPLRPQGTDVNEGGPPGRFAPSRSTFGLPHGMARQSPAIPSEAAPVEAPAGEAEGTPAPYPAEGPLRPQEEARLRAQKILQDDPAFRHTREIRPLRYEPTGREPRWLRALLDYCFTHKEPAKSEKPWNMDFLKPLWEVVALLGKVVLVGGLLGFLLWLLYRFRHRLGMPVATEAAWAAPAAVAGLDIRPESLPPDVPAAARDLFRQGEARAALALLYRGALAELVHRKGMEIPASATEGDCLRAASGHLAAAPMATFSRLTTAWQRLAYKDEQPSPENFERLCESWPAAFEGRP